jgi:chitinase
MNAFTHHRLAGTTPTHAFAIALFCSVLTGTGATHAGGKEIIGYFPSWKWRPDTNVMTPDRIPYGKLTVINYAFWYPLADGTLTPTDTSGDAVYLTGAKGTGLVEQAHAHGVRILLSIGGWTGSDNFPSAASSAERRARFAQSCANAVRRHGFDGIDIDWEYPGYADHRGGPADRGNFTSLLRTLRDTLDAEGRREGKHLTMTAALPAASSHLGGIDLHAVTPLLDELNVMTYDFHGTWDAVSGHNSPLYASTPDDSLRCVSAAFRLYRDVLGVPSPKINLGVPFYGHAFSGCTGMNRPHTGPDTVHFGPEGGMSYSAIVGLSSHFTRHWDSTAGVPYLTSPEWNVVVSYDDEESVRLKAEYATQHGAGGLIIWEITDDFMPDGSTPLLDAIDAVFQSRQPPTK